MGQRGGPPCRAPRAGRARPHAGAPDGYDPGMTQSPNEHDQDSEPTTPEGEEPEVTHLDDPDAEPASDPDPDPGTA